MVPTATGAGSSIADDIYVIYMSGNERTVGQIEAAYLAITVAAGITALSAFIYVYLTSLDGNAELRVSYVVVHFQSKFAASN